MAEVKGRRARAAAAVLVTLLAIVGLPAQAAFAADAGYDVNTEPEVTNIGVGGDANLITTISPAAGVGGVTIGYENASDGEPGAPEAICTIPEGGTQCVQLLSGIPGATTLGSNTIVTYVDQSGCTQDRFVCSGLESEEQATAGARPEIDDTDVVTVNVSASSSVALDCSPDLQQVNLGTPATVSCTQTDQNGNTVAFEVDLEVLSGPADPQPGQNNPVDFDDVNGGASAFSFTVPGSVTPGATVLCFFVDTNTIDNDTGATGPDVGDGGDCAAEAVNPGLDDRDTTDVVCVAHDGGVCPGVVVPTPTPTVTAPPTPTPIPLVPPVISGEGCADGSDTASFRINVGQELEENFLGGTPLEDLLDLIFPPTTLSVGADDPDGGATTLSLSGAPSWIRLEPAVPSGDPVAALIVGEPSILDAIQLLDAGLQTEFTLVATDNEGQTDTCVFTAFVGPGIEFPGPLGA